MAPSAQTEHEYLKRIFDWSKLDPTIESLRGKAVVMQDWDLMKALYSIDVGKNKSQEISKRTIYEKEIKQYNLNSTDWTAHFYADKAWNKDVYNKIVNCTNQTGNTGIITIPNAGVTLDQNYGDLLLQTVIDCNFRFKSW